MKAATQVWIATALLTKERGRNADFEKAEILRRIEASGLVGGPTPQTLSAHVSSHCVASGNPSPDRDRMLTRTRHGHYRLYRPGDVVNPGRATGRVVPDMDDIPLRYRDLVRWYETEYAPAPDPIEDAPSGDEEEIPEYLIGVPPGIPRDHPMLQLRKLAMESGIWKGVDPDEYVRQLRADWD